MSNKIHGVTSKITVILILEITCFTMTSSFDLAKCVCYGKECLSENDVEWNHWHRDVPLGSVTNVKTLQGLPSAQLESLLWSNVALCFEYKQTVFLRHVDLHMERELMVLSLKQNLMQILCSLTSAIAIIAVTHENGVKKTAKTRKHVHLQRRQLADWRLKDTVKGT